LLIAVGLALIGVAIALAVRSPSVSSERRTFSEPIASNPGPVTVEQTSSRPSDTFLGVVLAVGAALVGAGAFYPRVESVEAGGVKIGLTKLSSDVKETVRETAEREALARGAPEAADRLASEAEDLLITGWLPALQPDLWRSARAMSSVYALDSVESTPSSGPPPRFGRMVTEKDIQEAVSEAALRVFQPSVIELFGDPDDPNGAAEPEPADSVE
jgi:hypothetical protein